MYNVKVFNKNNPNARPVVDTLNFCNHYDSASILFVAGCRESITNRINEIRTYLEQDHKISFQRILNDLAIIISFNGKLDDGWFNKQFSRVKEIKIIDHNKIELPFSVNPVFVSLLLLLTDDHLEELTSDVDVPFIILNSRNERWNEIQDEQILTAYYAYEVLNQRDTNSIYMGYSNTKCYNGPGSYMMGRMYNLLIGSYFKRFLFKYNNILVYRFSNVNSFIDLFKLTLDKDANTLSFNSPGTDYEEYDDDDYDYDDSEDE